MDNEVFRELPFSVQVCGRFPPGWVETQYDPTPRPTNDELESLIAQEWDKQVVLAKGTGRLLFNGELFRYAHHDIRPHLNKGETFVLTIGPTCYRDFVGTNLFNHDRLAEFGWDLFANPVGTTATLISSDNRICYGRRSAKVVYHANYVHTLGGSFEKTDQAADGSIDPFSSVCRELAEEVNVSRDELGDICCVGLIRDKEIHQPEMLFEASLAMTAAELRDRWMTAEHRDEHDELVTLADEPDAIVPFIRSCGPIAPVTVGALFLHGYLRWGDAWVTRARGELHR